MSTPTVEDLIKEKVQSKGLDYSRIILDTGRIRYSIAGKTYIPQDAANTFLDGGWAQNYRDI